MFEQLFAWVRRRIAEACVAGVEDAVLSLNRVVIANKEREVSPGVTLLLDGPPPQVRRAK